MYIFHSFYFIHPFLCSVLPLLAGVCDCVCVLLCVRQGVTLKLEPDGVMDENDHRAVRGSVEEDMTYVMRLYRDDIVCIHVALLRTHIYIKHVYLHSTIVDGDIRHIRQGHYIYIYMCIYMYRIYIYVIYIYIYYTYILLHIVLISIFRTTKTSLIKENNYIYLSSPLKISQPSMDLQGPSVEGCSHRSQN